MNNRNSYRTRQKDLYPKNEDIAEKDLLVIDHKGEQLGPIKTSEALKLAKEVGLDLVEVGPNGNPPVAKILSWSKFKYQLQKKKKDSQAKKIDQKEMWFKAFIGEGDMQHKLKKVIEFLQKKHPVKITIKSKRRVTRDHLKELLDKILLNLEGYIEQPEHPKYEGHNLSLIVRPTKTIKPKNEKQD